MILYGEDNCKFLLENLNNDCFNTISEYLCIGYTLNNETIYAIKQIRYKPYTIHTFGNNICKLLNQYDFLENKIARIKQSELLYRTINMYYSKIAGSKTKKFTQITYNKAITLEMECNNARDEVNNKYIHNYNTRYNCKRRQNIELLHISRYRFIKEAKESLILLNNLKKLYPMQTSIIWI